MRVSVVVTSYNSSMFIEETLESVKAQTYPDIELIVSDDGSTDDTVEKARRWLEANAARFVRTDVVTVPVNTGVSANCNRSMAATHSEWVKFIAGDDILLPGCLEDNLRYVAAHPETSILFSYVRLYRNVFDEDCFVGSVPSSFPHNIMDRRFSARDQYQLLLLSDRIRFTPSYFFRKQALLSVGGYDESNTQVEDYPMWLKLTSAGYRLEFMEKETVGYRQHDRALNNREGKTLFSESSIRVYPFRKRVVFPELPWDVRGAERWSMGVNRFFHKRGLNRQTSFLTALYRLATVYANPFQYLLWVRRRILGAGRTNMLYSG